MTINVFIPAFKFKSDLELETIVREDGKFVDQARLSAIQILRERNGESELTDSAEKKIRIENEEKKKKNFLTDDPNAPELHSKRVIWIFSAFFSTIFGAVLLMYNMKQTQNNRVRFQVLIFGILYTAFSIYLINLWDIQNFNITMIFNFGGGAILTDYFWNKFIGKEYKYRKRSWFKPAIVSVVITIPFILAMIYG